MLALIALTLFADQEKPAGGLSVCRYGTDFDLLTHAGIDVNNYTRLRPRTYFSHFCLNARISTVPRIFCRLL
jgi:hypothetical protein